MRNCCQAIHNPKGLPAQMLGQMPSRPAWQTGGGSGFLGAGAWVGGDGKEPVMIL